MNVRKTLRLLQAATPVLAGTALPAMAQNATPAVTNAPAQLPTVVVTGGKITTASRIEEEPLKVPFNASVVTKEELQRSGAATLEEAMRSISGLQHGTQGNFFTRFETRGLRDTQDVLVLVDGVPLRLLQGNADVILIPTLLLERVEFIKGPASSVYGRGAVGGVVQFFTKPEATEKFSGEMSLRGDSFNSLEAAAKTWVPFGQGGFSFAGGVGHSDGFQRGTDRDTQYGKFSFDQKFFDPLTTEFGYFFSGIKALRGSIVPLQNGRPMFGITQEDNFGIPGVFIDGEYHSLSLRNHLQLAPEWSLEHRATLTLYDRHFEGGITIVPPPTASNKGYTETDLADHAILNDILLKWDKELDWGKNAFQLGLSAENGGQKQDSPNFTAAPTYVGPNYNTPVSNVANDPRGIRGANVASYFVQDIYSVTLQDRVEVAEMGFTLGARFDNFEQSLRRSNAGVVSEQEKARFSPRAGFDWTFYKTEAHQAAFFANYAEGVKPLAPALSTLAGVVVPQLLKPEVTINQEVGLKFDLWQHRVFAQVSYFNMEKKDGQRSFRTGPNDFIFTNARTRTKGVETDLRVRFNEHSEFYGNYAWHDARHLEFVTTPGVNFAGYRVRMSAEHLFGLGHNLSWDKWNWNVSANYVGSRPLRDNTVNPQILPSYTLLNTAVSYRLNAQWEFLVGVNNLTDEYYINDDFSAQNAGNAGAPRNFFGQVRFKF